MSGKKKSNRKFRSLKMESLEKRELMAANVTANLSSTGTLTIEGTERADSISVQQGIWLGRNHIEVRNFGSVVSRFTPGTVRSIQASLLGGNDRMAVTLPQQELNLVEVNFGNGTNESAVINGSIGTVTIDAKASIGTSVSVRDSNIRDRFFADFGSDNIRDTFDARQSTVNRLDLKMGGGNDDVHLWASRVTNADIDLGTGDDTFRDQNSSVDSGVIDGKAGANTWRGQRYRNVRIVGFRS